MRKRGVNLLLVLTLIIAVGTVVQDFRFDNSIARERAAGLSIDRALGSAADAVAQMRAAQAGYVATGQGPAFWMTRVSDLAASLETTIITQRAATSSAEARARYDAAALSLADLTAIDKRVRSSLGQSDRFSASDLIFIDSRGAAEKLTEELAAARAVEAHASEARLSRLGRLRLVMNAMAIGFVLVVAVYLGRSIGLGEVKPAPTTFQMLRDLPPPVKSAAPPPPVVAPPAPPTRLISLSAAAELCVDLARVIDGRDVPALVERAAGVLEAKGIVLWVADTSGVWLHPSITHGYPERVVAKLGSLQIDADNVTSLAFRSMKPQAISSATPGASGAIVAPLVTSSGCVGVLAAEVRQNKPGGDVLAVACIIAAQLAALVVPAEGQRAEGVEGQRAEGLEGQRAEGKGQREVRS